MRATPGSSRDTGRPEAIASDSVRPSRLLPSPELDHIEADPADGGRVSARLGRMRRTLLALVALLALAAVVAVGLTQADEGAESSGPSPAFDLERARRDLAGAPVPLASLHDQANQLLPGGEKAFRARLESLRGHPVVVNKWASWCGPCRAEFPAFQRQATERGKEIAFLGIDSGDTRGEARTFLRDYPVPFPSYEDPDGTIAKRHAPRAYFPTTVFIDERGRTAFIHQGGYASSQALAADIDRHLGRG